MNQDLILAIDQGTTGTKVLLFDKDSQIRAQAYREITQYYPQPGWVEHDLKEIWSSVVDLINEVLSQGNAGNVKAIAITNQRETTAVWDRKTGAPLAPAVVWQCRRSVEICKELKNSGMEEFFRRKTGLMIDPYFSGTKVKWLLDHVPGLKSKAEKGEVCFGTIDTWLLWNLTEGKVFATDYSNASRTLLYNIYELCWDNEILKALGIPKSMLADVLSSSGKFGSTVQLGNLPAGIPITGLVGDSQGALFGEVCFKPGMAKATYGTGTSMMMYAGKKPVTPSTGLVATLAWGIKGDVGYAIEGIINVTGATMQWLRDGLGIIDNVAKSGEIAASLEGNEGVYLVPAFVGLCAPYWDMEAKALITGLTRGTKREHLIRAGLESIAYQVRDVLELIKDGSGIPLISLRADGGAAANEFLMQFQADLLNAEVARPHVREVSALGATYLAGLEVGFWENVSQIADTWRADRKFTPRMVDGTRERLYIEWKIAVSRALTRS
jgi:glycerol kinase